MSRGRTFLRVLAGGWLALQLAAAIGASISMGVGAVAMPVGHHSSACCPGVAPGQTCPMHHTREGGRTCTMRGTCGAQDAVLLSLFSAVGLASPAPVAHAPDDVALRTLPLAFALVVRTELPESPPPRS
jgi:hypothetical protein